MTNRKKNLKFEQSIQSLEKIVGTIEAGELSLEDALTQFEQGVKLTRDCHQALTQAEQTVQRLIKQNGQETLENFAEDDFEDDDA